MSCHLLPVLWLAQLCAADRGWVASFKGCHARQSGVLSSSSKLPAAANCVNKTTTLSALCRDPSSSQQQPRGPQARAGLLPPAADMLLCELAWRPVAVLPELTIFCCELYCDSRVATRWLMGGGTLLVSI